MKVFRVVADSSCLIGLEQIGIFGLLREMFAEIYIPGAVYEEVVVKGRGEAGSAETESAVEEGWISIKAVNNEIAVNALTTNFGKGESEVIILCKESGFDYALIDERSAREKAALMSVNTMGVLGFMDLAIEMGFAVDKKKLVKQLREAGFRISNKLYKKISPDN